MSEQTQPSRFMEELDRWTEANVISPLAESVNKQFDEELLAQIKKSVRIKVLENASTQNSACPLYEWL